MAAELFTALQIIIVGYSIILAGEWLRSRDWRAGAFAGVGMAWLVQLIFLQYHGNGNPGQLLGELLQGRGDTVFTWLLLLTLVCFMRCVAFCGHRASARRVSRILMLAQPVLLSVLFVLSGVFRGNAWAVILPVALQAVYLVPVAVYLVIRKRPISSGDGFVAGFRWFFLAGWVVFAAVTVIQMLQAAGTGRFSLPAGLFLTAVVMDFSGALLFMFWRHSRSDSQVAVCRRSRDEMIRLTAEISARISEENGTEPVLQPLLERLCTVLTAEAGCVLQFDKRSGKMVLEYMHGVYPPPQSVKVTESMGPEDIANKFRGIKIKLEDNYMGRVFQSGQPVFSSDTLNDSSIEQLFPGHFTLRSVISVPLTDGEGCVNGVLSVMNPAKGLFTEEHFQETLQYGKLVSRMLDQVVLNSRMVEQQVQNKEMEIAANIQRRLMPIKLPEAERVELGSFHVQSAEGGGDYYDILSFGKNRFGVIMADIAGKGIPAALAMVTVSSVLQAFARGDVEAKEVIMTINKTLAMDDREERFATVFYMVFNADEMVLNYSNAGHSPLLLYSQGLDSFARLDSDGMPVGIDLSVAYQQFFTCLGAGDIAVLFTDGIIETMNENRDQFGLDRLKSAIKQNKHLSAGELADKIKHILTEFSGKAPRNDDQTLFIMKVNAPEETTRG